MKGWIRQVLAERGTPNPSGIARERKRTGSRMRAYEFRSDDGTIQKRKRHSTTSPVPNIDTMPQHELLALVKSNRSLIDPTDVARRMFPDRPVGFLGAATALIRMARLRKRGLALSREYEEMYKSLPKWAQFPRGFDVSLAVAPGKRFRKYPPKLDLSNIGLEGENTCSRS